MLASQKQEMSYMVVFQLPPAPPPKKRKEKRRRRRKNKRKEAISSVKTFQQSTSQVSSFCLTFSLQTLNVHQLLKTKAIQSSHTFAKDKVNGLLNRGPEHLKVATKIEQFMQIIFCTN